MGVALLVVRTGLAGRCDPRFRRRPATRASGPISCRWRRSRVLLDVCGRMAGLRSDERRLSRRRRAVRAPSAQLGRASCGSRRASLANAALITTIGFILSCTLCFVLAVRGFKAAEGAARSACARWLVDVAHRRRDRGAGVLDVHAVAGDQPARAHRAPAGSDMGHHGHLTAARTASRPPARRSTCCGRCSAARSAPRSACCPASARR